MRRAENAIWKMISLCLAVMIVCSIFPMSANSESTIATKPVIKLTEVPKYGDASNIKGLVYTEDGSNFNVGDYRVSLYLQISENGTYWVKPYESMPYTTINNDGTFSIQYATGGRDKEAVALHIMLIPSSFTPSLHDFDATKAVALDYVLITRTSDGLVTINPNRQGPSAKASADNSQASTGKTNVKQKPKKVSKINVSKKKLAVDVGFYIKGSPGGSLSKATIKKQLKAVKKYSNTVRLYGAGGQLTKAYKIAHKMGFKVIGSAWLSGNKTEDKKELKALVKLCKKGYVSVACVGSETLKRRDLSQTQLVSYMRYVKKRISKKIPVTTADDLDVLLSSKNVCKQCDLLMVNVYPFWGGVSIGAAADTFAHKIADVQRAYPTKEIIVSETGWPTAGNKIGAAKPSGSNARKYFNEIRKWSVKNKIVVLWFDAADEPWKASNEGSVGAHWGLMTKNCKLKSCYKKAGFFKNKK